MDKLKLAAIKLLEIPEAIVEQALSQMLTSGSLLLEEIDGEPLIFLPHLRKPEEGIAAKIKFLAALAELEALGLAFVSLRDHLDLGTPSGRLMFQIIGAMAEFERALIQERVRAGLRHARAKGKRLGRPRAIVNVTQISLVDNAT